MMPLRIRFVLWVSGAWVLLLAGCAGQPHRLSGFGVSNREAFARQVVHQEQRQAGPNMTLDSQEAEVLAQSYLRGLSGKVKAEPEPVLYVAPQRQGGAAPQLPPSVPKK